MIAIGLGLLPLLMLEGLLWVCDRPQPSEIVEPLDPYLDLHHLRPLFTLDEQQGVYRIGPERLRLFRPASFSAAKPDGSFRIFALGGSTTQGEPYSTETAFPEWLKLNLQAQSSQLRFESINCGGLSYASYRVLAILREVLEYSPDLVVIYTGQNEFLERRSYQGWQAVSPWMSAVHQLAQLRTVRWLGAFRSTAATADRDQAKSANIMAREVEALLDYQGGLEEYHRLDAWREPVVKHFLWNVEQMILLCQRKSVPLILMRPVSNLRDCPPIKFEIDPRLTTEQQARFQQFWDQAKTLEDVSMALAVVEKALNIDPQHAGALFLKGVLLTEAGEWEVAKQYLELARDNDVCPLRAFACMADGVAQLAKRHGVPCVDAERLLSDRSPHGIPGSQWLVDHVHPTVEGHQLLGELLAETCLSMQLIPLQHTDWQQRRSRLYQEHMRELGEDYFIRGKQRLEGLLLWANGRAQKVRPTTPLDPAASANP